MNKKTKVAVIAAVVLLLAGVFAFAQNDGKNEQKPPFTLGGPGSGNGRGCGGGNGGGGCCGGSW